MSTKKHHEVPREGEITRVVGLEPSDAKHIRDIYAGLHAEVRDGDVYVRSQRKVGAIGVPSGESFYIRPKVEGCSLLHMLALSERLDDKVAFDAEEAGFETGDSFVDLIAYMFVHELSHIFQRGLDQQYQEKQERQRYLRGRLDLQRQLQHGPGTTTFECVFDELTHDTLPNQLLYHAADTLRSVVSSEPLTGQIRRNCRRLEAAFDPKPLPRVTEQDIQFSHLNRYYERGIELAEFILEESYVQGFAHRNSDLSSFTVDMPNTFDDAIYHRLRTAINLEDIKVKRDGLGALAKDPDTKKTRNLDPDFIIRDESTDKPLLVGDMKWKTGEKESEADDGKSERGQKIKRDDLYQMFAYQVKSQSPGLLIYPDNGQQLPDRYEYQTSKIESPLYFFKINVTDSGYEQTKKRIDDSLRQKIFSLLPP